MDEETRKALVESICHWVDNYLSYRELNNVALGPNDCALCQRFFFREYCYGCPVKTATGTTCCRNTPYLETVNAMVTARMALTETNLEYLREKIHDELMFLHSLLKPAKETN